MTAADTSQSSQVKTYTEEEYTALLSEKEHAVEEATYYKEKLNWLQRQLFGQKSEKGVPTKYESIIDIFEGTDNVNQSTTVNEATEEIEVPSHKRKKRPKNQERQPFPDHLERVEEYFDIPDSEKECPCGCGSKIMGYEKSEKLEYTPASCFVKVLVRPKWVCCKEPENGVKIAHLPKPPVAGRVGASVLSYIFVSKYCDHLPLERIENIFKRQGVRMPVTTMIDYLTRTFELLSPLLNRLHEAILDCMLVNVDETTIKIQSIGPKGKCHLGYYWCYIGDKKYFYVDYRSGRSRHGPLEFLDDFQGEYLQADEYAGYNEVVRAKELTRAGCWAHARRKFVKANESGSKQAGEVVSLIGMLYKIEKDIKEADYNSIDEVKKHRLEYSVPQLDKIKVWLKEKALKTPLKKGDFAEALHYCLNNFENLTQYAHNPVFDIDNNIVERSIRQIAVGRKNWLFAGSEEGAKRSALMYSLIGTCKMHDVEPYEYLNDVITRITEYPKENLHHLLPDLWKAHFKKNPV